MQPSWGFGCVVNIPNLPGTATLSLLYLNEFSSLPIYQWIHVIFFTPHHMKVTMVCPLSTYLSTILQNNYLNLSILSDLLKLSQDKFLNGPFPVSFSFLSSSQQLTVKHFPCNILLMPVFWTPDLCYQKWPLCQPSHSPSSQEKLFQSSK